ncbi:Holliday junction resolvase RecU [Periweissella beninensis]|uniref:Holliday junction resolvase RecU n=1 Tax=Periweissella beninensis TaxID=504936 RepID=UPI0021A8C646|nr:Holliday junction resolvase RecU [Periweissella beninensis]MCT4396936.1 Holliday junction resolvase RecU [Periweissella beninensis]
MIRYPNGNIFNSSLTPQKTTIKNEVNYGSRGMTLEYVINLANEYYLNTNTAVIHKKPTPINIVNVAYPNRAAAKITEAYFSKASTTDYNGIYQGYYLDFDAKETKNKTALPLSNFHQHQIDHLNAILQQGGIGFILVRFIIQDEIYVYPANQLITFWQAQFNGGRKSIPYDNIKHIGYRVSYGINPTVPYLSAVKNLITATNK